jgi:hypothetical protein
VRSKMKVLPGQAISEILRLGIQAIKGLKKGIARTVPPPSKHFPESFELSKERHMDHEYNPVPSRTRALLAIASTLLSTLVLGLVVSLAAHYSEQVQVAHVERSLCG